jgi:two-component system, LytTR family, sensor kinase
MYPRCCPSGIETSPSRREAPRDAVSAARVAKEAAQNAQMPLETPPLQWGAAGAYASKMSGSVPSIPASSEVGAYVRAGLDMSTPATLSAPAPTEAYPERAPLTRTELLLILGFWSLVGILTSANRMIEPKAFQGPWQPVTPVGPVLLSFATAYVWALLTVPIFRLTSRYTLERLGWLSGAGFVFLGVVLAILVDIADSYLRHAFYYAPMPLSPELVALARLRSLWFMNDFIVYVAVLAAGFARNYFLNYRVRREEAINLKAQAAQLQAQLADARLSALRTQLNPHFLFNTLNAVSALVERDPRGVRRMIARLSELLRTSLDEADEPEVPLHRELAFIDRYLEVMQIRFQGRLHVRMHADPEVNASLVPNLILQPLVENAMKHGVSKTVGAGRIEIRAQRIGERVVLSVHDSGPGLASGKSPTAEGVGLRNTRQRLAQLYGPEQSLTLRPADGGDGLIAEVSLPYHTQADLRIAAVSAEA